MILKCMLTIPSLLIVILSCVIGLLCVHLNDLKGEIDSNS